MSSFDLFIQNYFLSARTAPVTEFMRIISRFFDITDPIGLLRFIFMVSLVAVLILLLRNIGYSVLFISSLFVGAVITYFLKIFFGVARPVGGVIASIGQSFPSYHATIATVFFIMLIYIFDDFLRGLVRKVFNMLCILGIFLVATSRVYLGVHWASDVLAGIILGCLVSYLMVTVFRYKTK